MAIPTLIIAALLVVLGGVAYALSQAATALIPAAVGVIFAVFGALALQARWRKHAMHAVALLALLATGASASRLPTAWTAATEGLATVSGERGAPSPLLLVSVGGMFVLSAVLLGLCVRSFIEARKAQRAAKAAAAN